MPSVASRQPKPIRKIGAAAKWIAPPSELLAQISKTELKKREVSPRNDNDLVDEAYRNYLAGFVGCGLIHDDRPEVLTTRAWNGDQEAIHRIVELSEIFTQILADLGTQRPDLLISEAQYRSMWPV